MGQACRDDGRERRKSSAQGDFISTRDRVRRWRWHTKTASAVPKTGAAHAWLLVALLFLFMLTNCADRAVLGLAAVPIMQELGLTHSQFGLIATSFFSRPLGS